MDFYKKTIKAAISELGTSENGLSEAEAQRRIERYGHNIIEGKEGIHPLRIFLSQFNSPLMWVLIAAIVISYIIGEGIDALIIGIILLLNSIIGFAQEYNAEKAIEALKRLASLKAIVIRNCVEKEIDAKDLVPGDIIILRTGDKIPADSRIIEAVNLQAQEGILTGESVPIKKIIDAYDKDLEVADRKNMVYAGTLVTAGRGVAIVTETGMNTQKGKIAHMIQQTRIDQTPLQKQLKYLGKLLGILTVIVCAVVFIVGVLKGEPILSFFLTAVSLAVAAIPEGLPAVVTIALAIGIKRMASKNALIRRLPSVETLGCATVICTDKTGTLTMNEMTVTKVFVDDEVIDISGTGYDPKGRFSINTKSLPLLLKIGALNNDAELVEKEGKYEVIGDPTEGALIVSAAKAGLDRSMLENKHQRIDEVQFSAERKMMTTVHRSGNKNYAYIKGAPDIVIKNCRFIEEDGHVRKMTEHDLVKIHKINLHLAEQALRVLAFAYKETKKDEKKQDYEKGLVFVGLQAMMDPLREEARDAVKKCDAAGIRVVMITGDFKGTAEAIAKELGIKGKVVTGEEINRINLNEEVLDIGVYARVNPEHKLRIIEAFKNKGHVVAMTGDGINDAPALKKADIGIAMGKAGTDVAKEASDMILIDDSFNSIVSAIEEGRFIYSNVRKFVNYLISSNMGEVLTVFIAIIIGLPLPLVAVQLLWINLITDGLPALALSVDPSSPGTMQKPPRNPKSRIIERGTTIQIFLLAMIICSATLIAFWYGLRTDINTARTIAFTTLVFTEIAKVNVIRKGYGTPIFSNRWLWMALGSSIMLQLIAVYGPLARFFDTVPLGITQMACILGIVAAACLMGIAVTRCISKRYPEEF